MDYTRRGVLSVLGLGLLAGCAGRGGSSPAETEPDTIAESPTETQTTTVTTTAESPTETSSTTDSQTATTDDDPTAADETVVAMENVAFSPLRLSIDPGTTVVWENREGLSHNVRAQQFHDVATDWEFRSETVGRDGRIAYEFEREGIYEYDCGIHGSRAMCGVVLVGDVTFEETLPCEE
ncbi:plastocyanin/azurin family copper-binding protein [Haloferax namakaokahaiae]|uniref:Plastocyanin/azurin family copper-binding protein n=1 Tax=Haloferax namakaokahaiae TaxID=1748331 RepID=A0ABD5ZFG1_9EURY